MIFRPLLILLILFSASALPSVGLAKEGELTIVRVYTGWRDAASFKRISEYFVGKENTGGEAVLRTHPDQRAGFYFLVRVSNSAGPRSVKASLQLITEKAAKPVLHHFTANLKSGDTVFHLGLTGADWPEATANPVAWKLELTDTDGQLLATEKSYLWEKPREN